MDLVAGCTYTLSTLTKSTLVSCRPPFRWPLLCRCSDALSKRSVTSLPPLTTCDFDFSCRSIKSVVNLSRILLVTLFCCCCCGCCCDCCCDEGSSSCSCSVSFSSTEDVFTRGLDCSSLGLRSFWFSKLSFCPWK